MSEILLILLYSLGVYLIVFILLCINFLQYQQFIREKNILNIYSFLISFAFKSSVNEETINFLCECTKITAIKIK